MTPTEKDWRLHLASCSPCRLYLRRRPEHNAEFGVPRGYCWEGHEAQQAARRERRAEREECRA